MVDVKLPGVGPVDKKWLYVGGAGIAGFVGYAYWNRRRAADTEITDYTEADYAYDGGVAEYTNPGGSDNPVNVDSNEAPTSNWEWSLLVRERLTESGHDGIAVLAALGKYLNRMEMTTAQGDIIRAAIAVAGTPPVGQFPILTSPTTPAPSKGADLKAPSNLSYEYIGQTSVRLKWSPVAGANSYVAFRTDMSVNAGGTYTTAITLGGLKRNTSYTFYVRAVGDDGKFGPPSAKKTYRTKR
jgi:hypothetical protein